MFDHPTGETTLVSQNEGRTIQLSANIKITPLASPGTDGTGIITIRNKADDSIVEQVSYS